MDNKRNPKTLKNLRQPNIVFGTYQFFGGRIGHYWSCSTCGVGISGQASKELAEASASFHKCHNGAYFLENKAWYGEN